MALKTFRPAIPVLTIFENLLPMFGQPRVSGPLLLALCLGFSGVWAGPDAPTSQGRIPIGMNLNTPCDYQPGFPFKNLMWGARPWLTRNVDGRGPFDTGKAGSIPLDNEGYPLELPFGSPAHSAASAAKEWFHVTPRDAGTVVPMSAAA